MAPLKKRSWKPQMSSLIKRSSKRHDLKCTQASRRGGCASNPAPEASRGLRRKKVLGSSYCPIKSQVGLQRAELFARPPLSTHQSAVPPTFVRIQTQQRGTEEQRNEPRPAGFQPRTSERIGPSLSARAAAASALITCLSCRGF